MKEKNTKGLGFKQRHMLMFLKKYYGVGITCRISGDSTTQRVVKSLEKRNLIYVYYYGSKINYVSLA